MVTEQPLGVDDLLSFTTEDKGRRWKYPRRHDQRCDYSNPLGWEIRHRTPVSQGSPLRIKRRWRWDVYSPAGELIDSEPTFYEALRTAVNAMVQRDTGTAGPASVT